jgi:TetR/AcrR family transcriptional regulator
MARRTLDPESTRSSILEAAEELFADKGFDPVSMSQIARGAGVTKSLIHHHFGSKEELWGAVKERCMAEYFDMQRQMLEQKDDSAEVLLQASITTYFRFLQRNPRVVRMQAWLDIMQDPVMIEAGQSVTELGQIRLREAQERGELKTNLEPLHIIGCFLGMVEGWFRSRTALCAKGNMPAVVTDEMLEAMDESALSTICDIFFRGVLTES